MEALQFQCPMMVNRTISCAFPSRKSKQNFGVSNAQFLFFFLNRSSPRPVSFKIEANNSNFTITYLIESCGLAPEAATSVSQKVQLHSRERPDSVLTLLREHGLSKSQISNIVRKRPSLLLANPKEILLPKLEFFHSIGISRSDLARILAADPTVLTRSLEKQIIPSYHFLKSVLLSDEKVASALKRTSWIFLEDHSKKLLPNLSVLRATGVPESCLALLLAHFPEALIQKNDQFVKTVEEIKEMGFDPTKSTFVLAIHVMAGNRSIYNRCYEVYQRWGWSEDEILMSFRKHPNCMLLSEDKITKAMDFLVNKMGWPSGMIARCPVVLFFSLEKRIKPRCSVVQALRLKGLIKKTLSLSTVLLPDKKRFVEKYVAKYENQVPELWSVYEMKVDFRSVI
ncbi:transcription termination factor MTERF9, chloroplastic-like [Neltuma alba]|uniref:transcription termination factor MTERF9, chloroplastic-like n=1 Tax=Neltuma alba TaxID=207710 RepID=UPI0010A4ECA5|nr:transcription termination factor MTERF9, chloroplastic-like [Prosopis alba]